MISGRALRSPTVGVGFRVTIAVLLQECGSLIAHSRSCVCSCVADLWASWLLPRSCPSVSFCVPLPGSSGVGEKPGRGNNPAAVSSVVTVTGHAGHSSVANTVCALLQPLLFFRTSFILHEGTDVRALQAHTGCRSGKRKKRVCVRLSSCGGPGFFLLYFFMCFLKG